MLSLTQLAKFFQNFGHKKIRSLGKKKQGKFLHWFQLHQEPKDDWFITHTMFCQSFGQYNFRIFGCQQSSDLVFGETWDMLPANNKRDLDTLIKSLKFNDHIDFLMSTIRRLTNVCRGRYAIEDKKRKIIQHKMADSAQYF